MEKRKNWLVLCLTAGFLLVFALWSICKADDARSVSERRALAQRPELTAKSVWDGTFMTKFETYTLDQFPLPVSYTHLRAHETGRNLVCRLLLEKKKNKKAHTRYKKN